MKAREIAAELDRLNRARQQIEIAMLAEAEAEALAALGLEERGACVVVAGEGWPPGVVGIIAARLKERFERPAFALALSGAEATGSARSIPGVDLGRVVRAAVEAGLAIKGGGHAMAAGVTLARERLGDFRAFLEERLAARVAAARADSGLVIDAALAAAAATPIWCARSRRAGPVRLRQSRAAVRAAAAPPDRRLPGRNRSSAPARGRRRRQRDRGDRFPRRRQAARRGAEEAKGGLVHLAGSLSINRYGGREKAQLAGRRRRAGADMTNKGLRARSGNSIL